jgi:hypothetical protein
VGGAVTHQHVKLLSGVVPGYPASTFLQEPSAFKRAREFLYSQANFAGRPFGSGPFARTTLDLSGKPSAQRSSGPARLTRESIHRTRCWITDSPLTCRLRSKGFVELTPLVASWHKPSTALVRRTRRMWAANSRSQLVKGMSSAADCYAAFPRRGLAVSRRGLVMAEGRQTAVGHLESHTTAPSIQH